MPMPPLPPAFLTAVLAEVARISRGPRPAPLPPPRPRRSCWHGLPHGLCSRCALN